MHRGVIHYDELTECGLFKDASGQIHIFRKGDPVYRHVWTYEIAEKPPTGAVIPVMQPDRRPLGPPLPVEKPLEAMPRVSSAGLPSARVGLLNWIGMALSGLALLLLINIGGRAAQRRRGQQSETDRLHVGRHGGGAVADRTDLFQCGRGSLAHTYELLGYRRLYSICQPLNEGLRSLRSRQTR